MPSEQIEPKYISPIADEISAVLEHFRFVLPSLEFEGRRAKEQSQELQEYRSDACKKLGLAISDVWVEHYQHGPVNKDELQHLRTAVARSTIGLSGEELEGLLSVLRVRHFLQVAVNPQLLAGSKYHRRRKPPTA